MKKRIKYKYMRPDIDDKHGFLELQDKMLEIMVKINDFCQKNDIEYCLMGGSALGAKRHGGFIPWDDDMDIFMTADNYDKFRKLFKETKELPNYHLQEWGLTDGMITIAKVRDSNTTYIESELKDWKINQGIFIDIFILHVAPNNKLLQYHQYFWAKYVVCKSLANKNYVKRRGAVSILMKILKMFPEKFLIKHGLKQVYKYRDKNTQYYCNFLGKAGFKKGLYKKKWFIPYKLIKFENVELYGPSKIDDFLKCRFGDYMKIPSPERIKWEQHAEFWDTKNSYKNIIGDSVIDESKLM